MALMCCMKMPLQFLRLMSREYDYMWHHWFSLLTSAKKFKYLEVQIYAFRPHVNENRKYLVFAMFMRAIILIDNDWIIRTLKYYVFKYYVSCVSFPSLFIHIHALWLESCYRYILNLYLLIQSIKWRNSWNDK